MAASNILFAGFGGQGILFSGKVVAYAGLLEGKEVSWLPSYGPEMRGGTANCSVCIADEPISSPLVLTPDIFIAMNAPSYDKFIDDVAAGGLVVYDSSLIERDCARTDIRVFGVPATRLADEQGLHGLANIIILGKMLKESGLLTREAIEKGIQKSVPARKAHLIDSNMKAIDLGMGL